MWISVLTGRIMDVTCKKLHQESKDGFVTFHKNLPISINQILHFMKMITALFITLLQFTQEKQNNSQKVPRDDVKANITKRKGGAMHKEPSKPSMDVTSETSRNMNVSHSHTILSGQAPTSGSSGFAWAKRRNPEVSSTLSDGSRSKISALDPTFAKGTYDLPRHVVDASERRYKDKIGHDVQYGDSATQSYLSMDFDRREETDALMNSQVNLKSSGNCQKILLITKTVWLSSSA